MLGISTAAYILVDDGTENGNYIIGYIPYIYTDRYIHPDMVISINRRTRIQSPKYSYRYSGDPQNDSLIPYTLSTNGSTRGPRLGSSEFEFALLLGI